MTWQILLAITTIIMAAFVGGFLEWFGVGPISIVERWLWRRASRKDAKRKVP